MSIGIVAQASKGLKNEDVLYIQLKGKSVYRHPVRMSEDTMAYVSKNIKANRNKVNLRNWIKVS